MTNCGRRDRPRGLSLLFLFLIAATSMSAQQAESAQPAEPQYAGAEMCQVCHEDVYQAFLKNPHYALEKNKEWAANFCESCHGPGAKHAESMDAADIRNPAKLTPMNADEVCLGCHLNEPTHVGRIRGPHAKNEVACITCHPVHAMTERSVPPARRSRSISNAPPATPTSGPPSSGRTPIRLAEGAMACTDCHNPHGTFFPNAIRTVSANEPGCFRCHGDKRGPFVFEHAPVRLEGCTACHEPHGSANPRMLVRAEVANVCLECHTTIYNLDGTSPTGTLGGIPPGIHDLRNPRFQNCTMCHMKIHGSQVSREFLR